MALVIKLANLLEQNKANEDVEEYLDALGEQWTEFVEGELKTSNNLNNKNLGG